MSDMSVVCRCQLNSVKSAPLSPPKIKNKTTPRSCIKVDIFHVAILAEKALGGFRPGLSLPISRGVHLSGFCCCPPTMAISNVTHFWGDVNAMHQLPGEKKKWQMRLNEDFMSFVELEVWPNSSFHFNIDAH